MRVLSCSQAPAPRSWRSATCTNAAAVVELASWDGHRLASADPTFYRWFGVVDGKLYYKSTSEQILYLKADLEFSH